MHRRDSTVMMPDAATWSKVSQGVAVGGEKRKQVFQRYLKRWLCSCYLVMTLECHNGRMKLSSFKTSRASSASGSALSSGGTPIERSTKPSVGGENCRNRTPLSAKIFAVIVSTIYP